MNDLPQPTIDTEHIQYANDIPQIIAYAGKSRAMIANRTKSEIEKINYEKKWKIETNSKFKIVPLAVKKKHNIEIVGRQLQYSEKGEVLGITITRTGIKEHVTIIRNRASAVLTDI